jgi:hypothetical protein
MRSRLVRRAQGIDPSAIGRTWRERLSFVSRANSAMPASPGTADIPPDILEKCRSPIA